MPVETLAIDDRATELGGRLNVAEDGKSFRCEFIRPGPINYSDCGKGIELLRRETIEAALETFLAKPLTIRHVSTKLDPDAIVGEGRVNKVGRDVDSEWFFCEGSVDTDAGREAAIRYNPSCGYRVLATGPGGRWNNIVFERELTEIEFHHLALDPGRSRYEEADFRLNAVTNPNGDITMFKFFTKKPGPKAGDQPVTEELSISPDTVVKLSNGRECRLNTLVETQEAVDKAAADEAARIQKEKDDAAAAAAAVDVVPVPAVPVVVPAPGAAPIDDASRTNTAKDDQVVLVGGKPMTVKALREAAEARENSLREAADKAAAEERLNAAQGKADFLKLQAARDGTGSNRDDFPKTAGGIAEGLKRGVY